MKKPLVIGYGALVAFTIGLLALASAAYAQTPPAPPSTTPSSPTAACLITATPASIASGSSTTLSWSSQNATTFTIDNGVGSVSVTGSKIVSPPTSITYTATVTGNGETATCSATVTVSASLPPPPSTLPDGTPTITNSVPPVPSTLPGQTPTIGGQTTDVNAASAASIAAVVPAGTTFSRSLSVGSSGSDVTALQQILITEGYLNISTPTGYYGTATQAAVAALQTQNGLESVGSVGPQTRTLLNTQVSGSTQTTGSAATSSGVAAGTTFTRSLSIRSTGADVTALQQILIAEGYLNISAPTGYFGTATQAAVAAFQRQNGLEAVGSVGPLTRALLNSIVQQ